MARVIYCHPSRTKYDYHVYTDLDFWDARKILKDLATVKRNFGNEPSGDEYPTQVVGDALGRTKIRSIERRLARAVVSPPRHVIVKSMLLQGYFEFDPRKFYPARWSPGLVLRFTYLRLPLQQSALNTPYKTVSLQITESGLVRVEQVQRKTKHDPVVRNREDALRREIVPSCF